MTSNPPNEPNQLSESGSADAGRSAFWNVRSHLRLWVIAAIGLVVDLWTKHWAFTQLDAHPGAQGGWVVIPYLMSFRRSLNTGALFGLGKGLTPIFIGASILAFGFVLFVFYHSTRDRRSLHVALGLVLAGALGNLYDRAFAIADVVTYEVDGSRYMEAFTVLEENERGVLVGIWPEGEYPRLIPARHNPRVHQQGVVRDFIKMEPHLRVGKIRLDLWPWIFNIADMMLVVGVALLMLNFWWERKAELAAGASESVSDQGRDASSASPPPTGADETTSRDRQEPSSVSAGRDT